MTAAISRWAANRSAINTNCASRRCATSTSSATTNPLRPAALATSTSHSRPKIVVVKQAVPVGAEYRTAR